MNEYEYNQGPNQPQRPLFQTSILLCALFIDSIQNTNLIPQQTEQGSNDVDDNDDERTKSSFCNFSPTVSKRETGHSRIRKVHANYFCNRACAFSTTSLFLSFPVRRNVERNDAYICIYSVTPRTVIHDLGHGPGHPYTPLYSRE